MGGHRLAMGKPIKMFWSSMMPTIIVRREEEPLEPYVQAPHFMPLGSIPERNEDFDLWHRQEAPEIPQYEQGSSNLFSQRDPFKDVSKEAELPSGHYVSQSFVSKSHVGPDGKIVTERYASSAAGNGKEGIHEAKHLYSNSSSGLEKASHEQHLRGRARLAVTEYGNGQESASNQIFHGMNKTENEVFGKEFDMNAKHLPGRVKLGREFLVAPSNNFEDRSPAFGYDVASLLGHSIR